MILELLLENNLGDNEGNCIDFISCTPVDKDNPLMPLEYSFTVQYTDHSKIYLKQMVFQRQENLRDQFII